MKQELKVKFVDFWRDMNKPENNYFFQVLSEKYQVEFSDEPEVLFYSCFGNEYLKYDCTRIFYTPENLRPDFTGCDYALSFDYIDSPNHFRLPFWVLDYNFYVNDCGYHPLTNVQSAEQAADSWARKSKFCCIFVSNPNASERIGFYKRLNSRMKVDSAGRWNNTIGYYLSSKADEKVEFCKDYRFVISFENSTHPGYTTEKIVDAFFSQSIPVYWGNPQVGKDFNTGRFIHVRDETEFDAIIERLLFLDQNPEVAIGILSQPVFTASQLPECASKQKLLQVLDNWVEEARKRNFIGIARSYKKYLHSYNRLHRRISRSVAYRTKKLLSKINMQ